MQRPASRRCTWCDGDGDAARTGCRDGDVFVARSRLGDQAQVPGSVDGGCCQQACGWDEHLRGSGDGEVELPGSAWVGCKRAPNAGWRRRVRGRAAARLLACASATCSSRGREGSTRRSTAQGARSASMSSSLPGGGGWGGGAGVCKVKRKPADCATLCCLRHSPVSGRMPAIIAPEYYPCPMIRHGALAVFQRQDHCAHATWTRGLA